jgi:hypothetical protein
MSYQYEERGRSRMTQQPIGETKDTIQMKEPEPDWKRDGIFNRRVRSRSRAGDDRDDGEKGGFLRGRSRSSSRQRSTQKKGGVMKTIRRSLSRVRQGKKESKEERDYRSNPGKANDGHLPPMAPGSNRPPRQETKKEDLDEVERILAERGLLAEHDDLDIPEPKMKEEESTGGGLDSLKDNDVMKLDAKNTTMHAACLLHHSSDTIIERLENEPDLARFINNANESPLHYAAMDKQGVDKDVFKKLITLYPEAVKQPNVQNSLPIHLACMVGAPSTYVIKTFLKMYPKAVMMQTDFPLMFEDDMMDKSNSNDDSSVKSEDSSLFDEEFAPYTPKQTTAASGIASMFACAAPHQAAIEMAENARAKRREGRSIKTETGPKTETGFSALHLAVMNRADSTTIESLLNVNPNCLHLKTSRGRTALDCAQYIVRQHWLYGSDDEESVQNTFGAIEVMEGVEQKN